MPVVALVRGPHLLQDQSWRICKPNPLVGLLGKRTDVRLAISRSRLRTAKNLLEGFASALACGLMASTARGAKEMPLDYPGSDAGWH